MFIKEAFRNRCRLILKYFCNKCLNFHIEMFEGHKTIKLNEIKEIFIDKCKEENHKDKLEFYCREHNTLCCLGCISKIKVEGYGQHSECNVIHIKEIKDEKRNKLKENVNNLEVLNKNIEQSINKLKEMFEEINKNKEDLKLQIQSIFTKIRNALNEKEDQILNEIDKQCNDSYFKEDLVKECEKIPNKIKKSLEIGKKTIKDWKENEKNKLSSLINDCLIIEKNIKDIKKLEEIRKNSNVKDSSKFAFSMQEDEINKLINSIKKLSLINNDLSFPSEILKDKNEDKKLILSWLPKKPNKIIILLNSKIDGDSCKTLIEKCKGKKPTLVVIQTTKDIIFGGYATQEWSKSEKDEKAFVYSLKTKKKYNVKDPNYAIHASSWWGFGPSKNTIILYDNCLKHKDNWVGDGAYDIPSPYELNGGEKNFGVKSYEIFYIEYN